jgi:hypothetical protein
MGKKCAGAGLLVLGCLGMMANLFSQAPSEILPNPEKKKRSDQRPVAAMPAAAAPANGKGGAVADGLARLEEIAKLRDRLDREESEIIAAIQANLEQQRKEIAAVEEQLRRYMARIPGPATTKEEPKERNPWLGVLHCVVGLCPDCVERRVVVYSDPPGALVYVNNQYVGATPTDYYWVEDRKDRLTLVKDGCETLNVVQDLSTRWDELFNLHHISWIPRFKIRDIRSFCYTLEPLAQPAPDTFPRDCCP